MCSDDVGVFQGINLTGKRKCNIISFDWHVGTRPLSAFPVPLLEESVMELVKYNAACKAIAEAKSIDEVKKIHNISDAMRAYARQAKNKELEIDAAEIRIRAERRLGEMIREQKETVGLNHGGRPLKTGSKKDPVSPSLADAGIDKHLADRARKIAAVPEKQFEGMVSEWRRKVNTENERVTVSLIKLGSQLDKRDAMKKNPVIPDGKFEIIYIDPPWKYEKDQEFFGQNVERHYPTMDYDELLAMDLKQYAASNCVLYLWATSPKLDIAVDLLRAWGFGYKTSMIWDKVKHNMGFYASIRHEILLIGGIGQTAPTDKSYANQTDSVHVEDRTEHSKKPKYFYEMIEKMHPQKKKRIEFFARSKRSGWTSWGNEV